MTAKSFWKNVPLLLCPSGSFRWWHKNEIATWLKILKRQSLSWMAEWCITQENKKKRRNDCYVTENLRETQGQNAQVLIDLIRGTGSWLESQCWRLGKPVKSVLHWRHQTRAGRWREFGEDKDRHEHGRGVRSRLYTIYKTQRKHS